MTTPFRDFTHTGVFARTHLDARCYGSLQPNPKSWRLCGGWQSAERNIYKGIPMRMTAALGE